MNYLEKHPIDEKWFTEAITEKTIEFAKGFAEYLVEEKRKPNSNSYVILPLTTSQLRKFFGAVKSIQMDIALNGYSESDFVMLKPKLAYAVGRVCKQYSRCEERRIEAFAEVISKAIGIVNSSRDKNLAFKNFINFFEAIVAYHKHYGKDNLNK